MKNTRHKMKNGGGVPENTGRHSVSEVEEGTLVSVSCVGNTILERHLIPCDENSLSPLCSSPAESKTSI